MRFYLFLLFLWTAHPALFAAAQRPDAELSDQDLLIKYSKSFSFPNIDIDQFISDNRHKFDEYLQNKTSINAIRNLSLTQKQQLCWQCLLYMKKYYKLKDGKISDNYAFANLNMAKFLLQTRVYPAVSLNVSDEFRDKNYHSRLITDIARIVHKSAKKKKDRVYKWSRIYLALLSMDYVDRYAPSSQAKCLAESFKRLEEARKSNSTKTVNFYLARLILDPKFAYIPSAYNQLTANALARRYLFEMIDSEEQPRLYPNEASGNKEETPLYPVKSAQPAYLKRSLKDWPKTAAPAIIEPVGRAAQVLDAGDTTEEEALTRVSVALDGDITDEEPLRVPLVLDGDTTDEEPLRSEPQPSSFNIVSNNLEYSRLPMVTNDMPKQQDVLETGAGSSSNTLTNTVAAELEDQDSSSSSSSDDDSSSSDEDEDESISLDPQNLEEALKAAIESGKFIISLKRELAKKYPHPVNPTIKKMDIIRLIICLKQYKNLSHAEIQEQLSLFGEQTSITPIARVLNENGIKYEKQLTDDLKQEILVHYVAIKASAGKDAKLRTRDIARLIAQKLGRDENQIIEKLETLVYTRSEQARNVSDAQKKTICNMFKDGSNYPDIKNRVRVGFCEITNVILENIPPEELIKRSSIRLPPSLDRNLRDESIVQAFHEITKSQGAATVADTQRKTGYGYHLCFNVLQKAGLVERKTASKHLDEPTKEKIRAFWQQKQLQWTQTRLPVAQRYAETAKEFNATVIQVKFLLHPSWSKKNKQQEEQTKPGLSTTVNNKRRAQDMAPKQAADASKRKKQ